MCCSWYAGRRGGRKREGWDGPINRLRAGSLTAGLLQEPLHGSWAVGNGGGALGEPDGFEIAGGRGFYRPVGGVSFDDAVELVGAAIAAARKQGAQDLLVNTCALTGFASPDTFQRFYAAVEWAATACGRLRLAVVAQPEMIDPDRFGMIVAANRGLVSNIFTTEAEALAWLDAIRGPGQ
jgi:hypothetical protein